MSVRFEKETVRDMPAPGGRKHEIAHEIGERLTGGDTAAGYLAVCSPSQSHFHVYPRKQILTQDSDSRHTSSNSKRTLCAPRCLLLVPSPPLKKSWPHGSHTTGASMVTTSALVSLRWPSTEPLSARHWAMSSSVFSRNSSPVARA